MCVPYLFRNNPLRQQFPTCGSRPHVGSPSIFIGVATGRQTLIKAMHNCTSTMFALVSVKNCALSKLITCIIIQYYANRYITGHSNFMCVAFFFSISGVAVLREIFLGVARCKRLGIAAESLQFRPTEAFFRYLQLSIS